MYLVLSCIKKSKLVGRNDNFLAKARKVSILPTLLDVFDIRQHYIRILYLSYHYLQGSWSDIKGRQYTLMVCLFMAGFGYSLFSISKTVTLMFVARIPLGKISSKKGKQELSTIQ